MRENKGTEGRYGFYALLAVNAAVLVVAWHRRLWCVIIMQGNIQSNDEKVIQRNTFKNTTLGQHGILKSIQVMHTTTGKRKEKRKRRNKQNTKN